MQPVTWEANVGTSYYRIFLTSRRWEWDYRLIIGLIFPKGDGKAQVSGIWHVNELAERAHTHTETITHARMHSLTHASTYTHTHARTQLCTLTYVFKHSHSTKQHASTKQVSLRPETCFTMHVITHQRNCGKNDTSNSWNFCIAHSPLSDSRLFTKCWTHTKWNILKYEKLGQNILKFFLFFSSR